jgi:NTP pyrophosphatase (non-canonical NTP hydrolase)
MKIDNITEARLIRVLKEKYGTDILGRFTKLDEEVHELFEEFSNSFTEDGFTTDPEQLQKLRHEVCDVYAVLTSIGSILGMNQSIMINTVLDKLQKRENDPEYMKSKST